MAFGAAYGSVFGYEHWLPALWVNPMKTTDMGKLLMTAIGVGTVFTSVAIIINIVNHFMARKYFEGTFDRFGIIGLAFYWVSLGLGVWMLCGGQWRDWMVLLPLVPLFLLLLKEPLHNVMHRHGVFHGGAIGVVIPPSITFVVYGSIADASITDLFLSGLVPGLLMRRCALRCSRLRSCWRSCPCRVCSSCW